MKFLCTLVIFTGLSISWGKLVAQYEVSPPLFSEERGLYSEEFYLHLDARSDYKEIRYSLNGSDPRTSESFVYREPLLIDKTTIFRASVLTKEDEFSELITHTYLFPEDILKQSAKPKGFPDRWGPYTNLEGFAKADYEMDPDITESALYKDQLIPALSSLPSVSLVSDIDHFFSPINHPDSGGIYMFPDVPDHLRSLWERPVSFEYIPIDGKESIQVNAGVRMHGGQSRLPEKTPKHSLRLVFRSKYGPKKLNYDLFGAGAVEKHNSLVLLAGFNLTGLHFVGSERKKARYIGDAWVKDTFREMGYLSAHTQFVHLYLNGLYWGLYNLSERLDEDFMEEYLGGQEEDYDIIKDYQELNAGSIQAWEEMMELTRDKNNFLRIQGKNDKGEADPNLPNYLHAQSYIDYMILNFYIGNRDWDDHNWVAVRNRKRPGKGFQFLPWDSEHIFISLSDNRTKVFTDYGPSRIFQQFKKDPRFQFLLSQRVDSLLGAKGILSPKKVAASWKKLSDEVSLGLVAESARWGDYRRDVHSYKTGPYRLFTHEDWEEEQRFLFEYYFPLRTAKLRDQLKSQSLIQKGEQIISLHGIYPIGDQQEVNIFYRMEDQGRVEVEILNLEGQKMHSLINEVKSPGLHNVSWQTEQLPAGFYFYKIRVRSQEIVGKFVIGN